MQSFFSRRLAWSQWKHAILTKYLRVWVYKLSSRSKELAFIDACAGEGTYGDGAAGSPLLAVQWNDEPVLQKADGHLIVHACEEHPEAVARLAEALRPYTERTPPLAYIYNESFVGALPELLDRTRNVPTFVFIDPFGMADLTAERLAPLLKDRQRQPTEVLIRVDPVLMARFAGWLKPKERDAKGQRTAASFLRLLQGFDIDRALLEREELQGLQGRGLTSFMVGAYYNLLFKRFGYVQAIAIRPAYEAAPKYYLLHGTDNPHGAAHINDVVSTTEDELFDKSAAAADAAIGQGSFFSELGVARPPRLSVTVTSAEEAILEGLREVGPMTVIEMRAELALLLGPDLREKDHLRAMRNLIAAGKVTAYRVEIDGGVPRAVLDPKLKSSTKLKLTG